MCDNTVISPSCSVPSPSHSTSWMTRLRSSDTGSVYIRITNLLRETLVIPTNVVEPQQSRGAIYVKPFQGNIPSGCCSDAGIQCPSPFSTFSGSVTYSCESPNSGYSITFLWEYGYLVCRASVNKLSWPNINCVKYLWGGSEGTIHFYVIDRLRLPKLELMEAYLLDSNLIKGCCLPSLMEDETKPNSLRLVVSSLQLTPITHSIIAWVDSHQKETQNMSREMESASRDVRFYSQLNIANPANMLRAFLEKALDVSYVLYLEWRIGCQLYCNAWNLNEPIHLDTGFPGGCTLKSVVLSSTIEHIAEDGISDRAVAQKDCACSICGLTTLSHYPLNEAASTREDDIICYAVRCMRYLSDALNLLVNRHMERKYGVHWQQRQCQVSKNHVWTENKTSTLDLEGAIFVIIARWDEVFDAVFTEAGLSFANIKTIQSRCLYWSIQELRQFTLPLVEEFAKHSIQVLQALKLFPYVNAIRRSHEAFHETLKSDSLYRTTFVL